MMPIWASFRVREQLNDNTNHIILLRGSSRLRSFARLLSSPCALYCRQSQRHGIDLARLVAHHTIEGHPARPAIGSLHGHTTRFITIYHPTSTSPWTHTPGRWGSSASTGRYTTGSRKIRESSSWSQEICSTSWTSRERTTGGKQRRRQRTRTMMSQLVWFHAHISRR